MAESSMMVVSPTGAVRELSRRPVVVSLARRSMAMAYLRHEWALRQLSAMVIYTLLGVVAIIRQRVVRLSIQFISPSCKLTVRPDHGIPVQVRLVNLEVCSLLPL